MFHSVDMYGLKSLSTDLQVFSPAQVIFAGVGVLLSVSILLVPDKTSNTDIIHRRPRMLKRVKAPSLISSVALRTFSSASSHIRMCDRQTR